MSKITLYLKTHAPHIEQADRLVQSIYKYNTDNLPIVVSVNPNQVNTFTSRWSGLNINVIDDREVFQVNTPLDGWRYQQVVKSNFWRINPHPNYLCLDSDSVFIKPFSTTDFMYTDDVPYTICHESKDMLEFMALEKHDMNGVFYQSAARVLRTIIPNHGPQWDWGPSPFIWSNAVWKRFTEEYLIPNNLTFDSFLLQFERASGCNFSEYMVYGEYLLNSYLFPIIPRQPLFKVYHWKEQFIREYNNGVRMSHLKHNYLGVISQSNWGLTPDNPINKLLEEFFTN